MTMDDLFLTNSYWVNAYLQDSESSVETYHFLTPVVCTVFSSRICGNLGMGGSVLICTLCKLEKTVRKNGPSLSTKTNFDTHLGSIKMIV